MISSKLQAILLAAGSSSRFKTGKSKLLEKICGQEMILYSVKLLQHLNAPLTLVVGYQREEIKALLASQGITGISYAVQEEQLGTGHALQCTSHLWNRDHILIMNGDVPLVTSTIIEQLYKKHLETNAAISFVTAHNADSTLKGYGRVVERDGIIQIIEAKDFVPTEGNDSYEQCCINAGIYIVSHKFLQEHIALLQPNNSAHEFYLTDLVHIASSTGLPVNMVPAPFDQVRGINTFQELWAAEQIKRAELISQWMDQGVRFCAPHTVHIDIDITIGSGSHIECGVHLLRGTRIGKHCLVGPFSILDNVLIEDYVHIEGHSVIQDSQLESNSVVGPFARIHGNSILQAQSMVGNFVEVNRTVIGSHSKAKHLAYLGDARLGSQVTVGAGTITCNYNGVTKHQTVIEDHAFVGSNNTLVAPVLIARNAFTAAGSVITDDVPEEALAIGRSRQINKKNYAHKLRHSTETEAAFLGAIKTESHSSIEEEQ